MCIRFFVNKQQKRFISIKVQVLIWVEYETTQGENFNSDFDCHDGN